MTTNLTETEAHWATLGLPRAHRASVTLSAWTTDEEIAHLAAELEPIYGNRFETDTRLRLARADLRRAAMAAAESA